MQHDEWACAEKGDAWGVLGAVGSVERRDGLFLMRMERVRSRRWFRSRDWCIGSSMPISHFMRPCLSQVPPLWP
ncbi:hypothetical protein D779_0705 [Imhoffiella purpurea]|uniref:Uncharacterized protein n=1 Tax=Imhoffiella purpurea TaxID=1249627 RepID=W9VIS6_9GAMM|nr:hypothetical protein D779_0705 [Imhoffiella purpurea]